MSNEKSSISAKVKDKVMCARHKMDSSREGKREANEEEERAARRDCSHVTRRRSEIIQSSVECVFNPFRYGSVHYSRSPKPASQQI